MSLLDNWRFCPRCGGPLTIEPDHLACLACAEQYWANSIPGVQGILEREGRVLLARRGRDPRRGHWDLPGGFLAEAEAPLDGLRREFREETGLEIEPLEFLGIWMDKYGYDSGAENTLNLYWEARVTTGEECAADDVAELRWFAPSELPWDELAFECNAKVLSAWTGRNEHS